MCSYTCILWENKELELEIRTFSFKKMHLKKLFWKWQPFCLDLTVLTLWPLRVLVVVFDVDFFKFFVCNNRLDICSEIVLMWMPQNLTNEKSTAVLLMDWCCQAPSHHLTQCWSRFMAPYGVTVPQWIDVNYLISQVRPTRSKFVKYHWRDRNHMSTYSNFLHNRQHPIILLMSMILYFQNWYQIPRPKCLTI